MVGENIEQRRCRACGRPAAIECILCAKHKPAELPVFCSKACYAAHFAVHRAEGQGGLGSDPIEDCRKKSAWMGVQNYASSGVYPMMDTSSHVEYNEEIPALEMQAYRWSMPGDFATVGAYQLRNVFGEPTLLLGVCASPRMALPRNYWYKAYY